MSETLRCKYYFNCGMIPLLILGNVSELSSLSGVHGWVFCIFCQEWVDLLYILLGVGGSSLPSVRSGWIFYTFCQEWVDLLYILSGVGGSSVYSLSGVGKESGCNV